MLKNKIIGLLAIAFQFIIIFPAFSQIKTLPSVKIKNLKAETIDAKSLNNNGNPFLMIFYVSCCSPSLNALNDLTEIYAQLQEKFKLKIIAISMDDSRNTKKVAPMVKIKGWTFEMYIDENSDFKRAMNVTEKPTYILFNGKGELIWQKSGYMQGIEKEIQNELDKQKK